MNTPPTATHPHGPFGTALAQLRRARRRSQLDLALDADVSQRHLSYLECGRARPSRAMVLRLGDALELPLRERNRLLIAAGYAAWYPEQPLDAESMGAVRDAIRRLLAALEPNPTLLVDSHWRLLETNAAAGHLFGLLVDDPAACVDPDGAFNVLRATFAEGGLRRRIRNWAEVGPALLSRVRRDLGSRPDDARLAELLAALEREPGVRREWRIESWQAQPLPVPPMELDLGGGRVLRCYSMITTFGTAGDVTVDELHIETFVPADPDSAALLAGGLQPG